MKKTIALLIATTALASPAIAEDISVVGSWSSLPLHKQYEAPFWTTTLPEASGGNINVELTTHNAMSLGLGDIYPLLGQGVYDVAMTVADYAVSDAPELEGLDVPLLALTADEARAMVDAARRSEERRVGKECSSRWSPYQCNREIGESIENAVLIG